MDDSEVYGLYVRGTALLESGDAQGAVAVLEEAVLAAGQARGSLYEALARALFATAQVGRARRAFEHVVELDPTDHYAHFGIGRCCERQGALREAQTHYRLATALAPNADYAAALRRVQTRLQQSG